MKRLIVNADDFGITEGVTLGIVKAHKDGIVTSTTMMMNMPAVEFATGLAKDYPKLGLGIHITLTAGKPLLNDVPSLVDENGYFRRITRVTSDMKDNYPEDEVYREAKAQLEKFIQVVGKKPSHLDSHHFSMSTEFTFPIAQKLCLEYGIPYRALEEQESAAGFGETHFINSFYDENVTEDYFLKDEAKILEKDYALEIMCHPGYLDYEIYHQSSYNLKRMDELHVLTSESVKNWVKDNNISLINYNDL